MEKPQGRASQPGRPPTDESTGPVRRPFLIAFVLLAVLAAASVYVFPDLASAPAEPTYRLAKIDRGPIVATVNASGAINPTTTVIVGSQLSGQVVEILADYNSAVQAGQVVARLNSDQIRARLDAARADLDQIRAQRQVQEAQIEKVHAEIERARATQSDAEAQIARNEALLAEAERVLNRQTELRARGVAAEAALETARAQRDAQSASLESARAQLASARAQQLGLRADLQVAQAQVKSVSAQLAQREAQVRQIEVDLRNTDIRSPVSGVVIQRNIELGATVAASLQAPTLFLIADDLRQMEIAAQVDEADVGRVRPGQRVSFTVNAYPGRTFEGTVKQVRLGSQTVQNVVIYTAIVSVENPRAELLPGMTANLRIETERREDALRVPNAALRWRPPALASEAQPQTPGQPPGDPTRQAPPQVRPGGGGSGGANVQAFVSELRSELSLTSGQQEELDAILADARKSFAGNGEGDAAVRRERFRAMRADMEQRIAAILTLEQRVRFEDIRARYANAGAAGQTGRVFVLGRNGNPEGVTIRIGASDGGVTEIISGPLEVGREVIVAGGPRADARPSGPRFGF